MHVVHSRVGSVCGIAGYFDYRDCAWMPEGHCLDAMTDALRHRGPDGRGTYQAPGIGLGHRRLAIIDVSQSASQPMVADDGAAWIVFNGEIYNFQELRKELEATGCRFRTSSDTEVLLNAYLEWGEACVGRMDGIFAFAIWDARRNSLWLARDHLGVKPLFYADYNGKMIFASEVVSFFAFPGFPRDWDPIGVDAYLSFGYVPAPRTGYKHIKQLLPGHWLRVEGGQFIHQRYWDLDLGASKRCESEAVLIEEFDRLITRVVKRQMISDVPVGAFLSSGTDSFAVVRALEQINPGRTEAFSIGFRERSFDELPDTELAAASLGVRLVSRYCDMGAEVVLPRIIRHCCEPFADSSCLPTYLLCAMASEHVKVVLGGDGGDELLAGYETYRANGYAEWYRRVPSGIRRVVASSVFVIPESGRRYSLRQKASRFVYGAEEGRWRDHASWRTIFPASLKRRLYLPELLQELQEHDPIDLYAEPMRRAKAAGCSDLDCCLYADLTFSLPNDMLVKVDRMSMAHGLEVRVPLLDRELVEYAWTLPPQMKLRSGHIGKYILRRVIEREYPKRLEKRSKRGFNVPGSLIPPLTEIELRGLPFLDHRRLKACRLDHYQTFALSLLSHSLSGHWSN